MSCPVCKGTGKVRIRTSLGNHFLECPMCPLQEPRHLNWRDPSKRIQPLPTDLRGHICVNMNCPQGDSPHFHVEV